MKFRGVYEDDNNAVIYTKDLLGFNKDASENVIKGILGTDKDNHVIVHEYSHLLYNILILIRKQNMNII